MAGERVLIVEDEKILNEAYQTILKKEGYTVDVAFDGEEALEKVKAKEPSLILLDLRMPKKSGLEFLNAYEPTKHPNVKVIVFSNLDAQKEIDEAYDLGAHKYMLKAWASPKELATLVKDTLKLKTA